VYHFVFNLIFVLFSTECSFLQYLVSVLRKVWRIPKGKSEDVNRCTTDNTLAKRKNCKKAKKQKTKNNDLQNTTHKAKDRAERTH